jgi:hypothetical protein
VVLTVIGAVVATVTVADWVPLAPIGSADCDKVQVGAGVTTGVIAQVRFTVAASDPIDVATTLKFALCPALTIAEAGVPAIAKSGAAWTVSVSEALLITDPALP